MNEEYHEEPPNFGRPIIHKPKKQFISDSPEKTNKKPLTIKEIKKIKEKEMKEKEMAEIAREEKEEKKDENEYSEIDENEYNCQTTDISQNNNYAIKENFTIIDIKEFNKEQNTFKKNNSIIDYESKEKSIVGSIVINEPEKLNEGDLKNIIFQIFNNWQLNDIIKVINDDNFYFEKTFSIIMKIGILNCISYPFLNKILIAIIGKSIYLLDFGKLDYIYNSLKDKIVQHSQDIHSCHVIIALIEAFHTIKGIFIKKFPPNEININIIKNCEEKIDFIYSELKKNELIKIFMHKNATFVIQYLIDKINKERQEEIFDCVIKNINILINDKTGYFILRKSIEIIPENSIKCDKLIKPIIEYKNFQELLTDKIANFLIKNILKKTKDKYFDLIFSKIKSSICKLAKNQYASYVIEELIFLANKKQINEINKEINKDKEILLNDKYGNYVMKALKKKIYLK